MGQDRELGYKDYEWILYHKDMIDEVYADVPLGNIESGREFVLKFNYSSNFYFSYEATMNYNRC